MISKFRRILLWSISLMILGIFSFKEIIMRSEGYPTWAGVRNILFRDGKVEITIPANWDILEVLCDDAKHGKIAVTDSLIVVPLGYSHSTIKVVYRDGSGETQVTEFFQRKLNSWNRISYLPLDPEGSSFEMIENGVNRKRAPIKRYSTDESRDTSSVLKTWSRLIHAHHAHAHKGDAYELVTGPPATATTIAELEAKVGFRFPQEFREIYLTYDGVGVTFKAGEIFWMFTPIAEIPKFIDDTRDWFEETHPEVAKRFFPFIDWSNGDSTGYLLSASGDILPGLYHFEHEDYEFDDSQSEADFLTVGYSSIEELLKPE